MIVIGVTGSIATGKTTVSNLFKEFNINVFNDDKVVNDILSSKRMVKYFINNFNSAIQNNKLSKDLLRRIVFNDYDKLKILENIIHPLVNIKRRLFILKHSLLNNNIVVFDTPLLFEKNIDKQCDYVLVTFCNEELQKQRLLKRGTINEKEFKYILSKQMNNEEKISLADFSINTENSLSMIKDNIKDILNTIKS